VVAVLDSRLATARYSDFLRGTMPPFWYTTDRAAAHAALRRIDERAGV
jgi:ATP-dependent DNA helicase DinG